MNRGQLHLIKVSLKAVNCTGFSLYLLHYDAWIVKGSYIQLQILTLNMPFFKSRSAFDREGALYITYRRLSEFTFLCFLLTKGIMCFDIVSYLTVGPGFLFIYIDKCQRCLIFEAPRFLWKGKLSVGFSHFTSETS